MLTSEQIRAARALLRWGQKKLSAASGISAETIKRLEGMDGRVSGKIDTVQAIKDALEGAGVEFISENGGGSGVRLRRGNESE